MLIEGIVRINLIILADLFSGQEVKLLEVIIVI